MTGSQRRTNRRNGFCGRGGFGTFGSRGLGRSSGNGGSNRGRRLGFGSRLRFYRRQQGSRFLRLLGLSRRSCSVVAQMAPNRQRHIIVQRTRMSLFLMKAQLGQNFQNHARLDFQLSRQLVDTNLTQMFCSLLQHWQHIKQFESRFRATEATRYFLKRSTSPCPS